MSPVEVFLQHPGLALAIAILILIGCLWRFRAPRYHELTLLLSGYRSADEAMIENWIREQLREYQPLANKTVCLTLRVIR